MRPRPGRRPTECGELGHSLGREPHAGDTVGYDQPGCLIAVCLIGFAFNGLRIARHRNGEGVVKERTEGPLLTVSWLQRNWARQQACASTKGAGEILASASEFHSELGPEPGDHKQELDAAITAARLAVQEVEQFQEHIPELPSARFPTLVSSSVLRLFGYLLMRE